MNRIPPSKKICNEIDELFNQGINSDEDLVGMLIKLGTQRIIQEILENEVDNYIGREHYERTTEAHQGYRNGYKQRSLRTAEGEIPIYII